MLLAPLMAGQLLLALMASLVPQRFFSLVTVVFTLLAWQLGVVILIVHCVRQALRRDRRATCRRRPVDSTPLCSLFAVLTLV